MPDPSQYLLQPGAIPVAAAAGGPVGLGALGAVAGYQAIERGRGAKRSRGEADRYAEAQRNAAMAKQIQDQLAWAAGIDPELAKLVQASQQRAGGPLAPEQLQQIHQQHQTGVARSGMLRQINDYFTNPALAQQTTEYLNQQQQDALGGLDDANREATRQGAFAVSRAGVQGSSMEAEQAAALQAAQQRGVAGVVGAREAAASQIAARRRALRAQLAEQAIGAGADPEGTAARLQGLRAQGGMEAEQAGVQDQFQQVQRQSGQEYANILAGGVRGGANVYRSTIDRGV